MKWQSKSERNRKLDKEKGSQHAVMYKRNKRYVRQVKQRRKDNTTDWRKRDERNQGWENGSKAARKEWIGRPRLDRWKYERWKDERMKRRKGKEARQKWQKDKIKERTNMQTQHFIYSSDLADRITNCKLPAIQLHSDSNWRHPLFWCSARSRESPTLWSLPRAEGDVRWQHGAVPKHAKRNVSFAISTSSSDGTQKLHYRCAISNSIITHPSLLNSF